MKDRKKIREISEKLIQNTDIQYIAHYNFENLEWIVYSEIAENMDWEFEMGEIADILQNVYEYVFMELEKEKMRFMLYGLPTYKNILINKKLSKWKSN